MIIVSPISIVLGKKSTILHVLVAFLRTCRSTLAS